MQYYAHEWLSRSRVVQQYGLCLCSTSRLMVTCMHSNVFVSVFMLVTACCSGADKRLRRLQS